MKQLPVVEPELSRPLYVEKISAGGIEEHLVARPTERKALAKRFELLDLSKLEADLFVKYTNGKMISVTGKLNADIVQQCVVTLEPLPSHIEDTIDTLYAPHSLMREEEGASQQETSLEDPPEPIVDGKIDLGELVAQQLAVALDPYPRKEGVVLDMLAFNAKDNEKQLVNPFANLKKLKDKPQK